MRNCPMSPERLAHIRAMADHDDINPLYAQEAIRELLAEIDRLKSGLEEADTHLRWSA
jgi:hypothetical protein